jgi:hypothetical protein
MIFFKWVNWNRNGVPHNAPPPIPEGIDQNILVRDQQLSRHDFHQFFPVGPNNALHDSTERYLIKYHTRAAAIYLAGVKNCTDSVHKFSRAFLLCYESVHFLTPANQMAVVSLYSWCYKDLFSGTPTGNLITT